VYVLSGIAAFLDACNQTLNVMGWQIGLYKQRIAPTPATVWADIVECDFPGYARWTIDHLQLGVGPSPPALGQLIPEGVFTGTAPDDTGQRIYGGFLIDFPTAFPRLILVQPFADGPQPAPFDGAEFKWSAFLGLSPYNGPPWV